ncbi:hypothetical protein SLEP1_g6319 [Rubroshorea leprosula]|uniref:Uncharacterized protein n=1 Tax=Rubroshorea leprosula TaxID=152421 RepID=A0AAV5I317_9ROSI|nr:hypothetical protein SLEP1_g6319 [Rubroshorea leprosula]
MQHVLLGSPTKKVQGHSRSLYHVPSQIKLLRFVPIKESARLQSFLISN